MKRIFAIVALSIVAFSAHAQPYIGVTVSGIRTEAESAGYETRSVASLFAGYRASKHLAVEAGLFRPNTLLQRADSKRLSPDTINTVTRAWGGMEGYRLSLLGTLPVTDSFSILSRASAYRVKANYLLTDTTTQCAPSCATLAQSSATVHASETLLGFGLGAEFVVFSAVSARLMYEQIKPKAGMFGTGNDLDSISTTSIEVLYQF